MLALILAATVVAQSSFDAATRAYTDVDIAAAKRLFADAVEHNPDPHLRARAAIRLANIAWHIDRDAATARKWLDTVTDEEFIPPAWIERARIDAELTNDFATARTEAAHALKAPKPTDAWRAGVLHAGATIEPAMRGLAVDRAQLDAAKQEMRDVIAAYGPFIEADRVLLDAAILTNDGATALDAWRMYYGETAKSAILAPQEKALANWSDRRGAGLALAHSGFFREAALLLQSVTPKDREMNDAIAYARQVENVKRITEEYYRNIALKRADAKLFRSAMNAAIDEKLTDRFNGIVLFGNTRNVFDVHYAHTVLDEKRTIEQFGRKAPLQFVVLDGIVANGFRMWYGPSGGDGGWADEAIYQVRPLYANEPLGDWLHATDPELRRERDRNLADETTRDNERAAIEPVRFFPGVQLRIGRDYDNGVLDELKAKGLTGDALRTAFLARAERDTMESSIWTHEGRHAIDKKFDPKLHAPDLEYRAKLSQLEFAPSARHAILDIAANGNPEFGDTPHGKANRRLAQILFDWMKAHTAEIKGVDATKPLMLQLDKLTDDQLRAAARAADPWAK